MKEKKEMKTKTPIRERAEDLRGATILESAEIAEFVPTKLELLQVAKYWARERIAELYFEFLTGQGGYEDGYQRGRLQFAGHRICRIAKLIGEEEVYKAVREVEEEFGRTIGPRHWAIFTNGTPEEREAVRDEFLRDQ